MPDPPNLFFSHSLHALPAADHRCLLAKELVARLNTDWRVFKDDERIALGDRWRDEVYHSLSRCQAAIVYFNSNSGKPGALANKKDALTSDWVTVESLVLCLRAAFDKRFRLVPILLDGLDISDTCFSVFSPLQMSEHLAVEAPAKLDDPSARNLFIETIAKRLEPSDVPPPEPSELVLLLSSFIERLSGDMLRKMADSLDIHISWSTADQKQLLPPAIAQCIYSRDLSVCLPAIGRFKSLGNPVEKQEVQSLLLTLLVGNRQLTVARAVLDEPTRRQLIVSCDAPTDAELLIARIKAEQTDLQIMYVSLCDCIPDIDIDPVKPDEEMLDALADWLDIEIGATLHANTNDAAAARKYIEDEWGGWIIVCNIPSALWRSGLGDRLKIHRSGTTYLISGSTSDELAKVDSGALSLPIVRLPGQHERLVTKDKLQTMMSF